ncbi:MAG: hypothetical protein GY839_05430 [candidate division Zixibacteria bacterium]|nr:hypothetical protein [candidate division Zixibacteria bacterium]
MTDEIIQKCSSCGQPISAFDLIYNPKFEIIGMTTSKKDVAKSFYYFNHDIPECRTTILVKVHDLAAYIDEPLTPIKLTDSTKCDNHCSKIDDLQECSNNCFYAAFRRFLLQMMETKKKARDSGRIKESP